MFKGNNTKEATEQANRLNRFVEGTIITGNIVTDSNIRIDGELIGNLSTVGKLVIGPKGKINGDVVCSNADIEGELKGTLKVDAVLVLKSTAVVEGQVQTHKLAIENGAEFNGDIKMNVQTTYKAVEQPIELDSDSEMVY